MSFAWMGHVKQFGKHGMYAVAPGIATSVMSARARAHSHRLVRQWGLADLNERLIERFGSTVVSSPFRGTILSAMTRDEHLGPYLLGTYEEELHPWFESVIAQEFDLVLDVGSKFGYYAIGLARHMKETDIIAFDPDRWARTATREMAAVNGTPRVRIEGACSPRWMNRHLVENSLIVCDCEGYEAALFLGASTPALDSATLLIEIHDQLVAGAGAAIRERFRKTHALASVHSCDWRRAPVDLSFLSRAEAALAVREIRGPQEWMFLTPHRGARSCE